MKIRYIVLFTCLLSVFLVPGLNKKVQAQKAFEVSKNLEIFTTLYKEINTYYVDEIQPSDLMETGIESMLKTLDPYTVFIPESKIEDVRVMTTGKYGGIGALIQRREDYVIISEPYEDSPSDKAGLKAGDKILAIDGKSMKGLSSSDVSELLKGEAGTSFLMEVEHYGNGKADQITITRENIQIPDIPFYEVLENQVGYIKLTGFTQQAGVKFKKAFNELRAKAQLNGLIIDLRDNGGGLLNEAVDIVNLFVPKGELIVNTKGRLADRSKSYHTRLDPTDTELPIVVLVNSQSASASEILSGSVQDLDRGLIVGHRTYGKGLVQNVLPLSYNSQLKVTVAKYYIPSGRCIQAIDYSHKDENGHFGIIPDSLISEFTTKNGRKVYDGGGVQPDVITELPEIGEVTINLFGKNMFFDFANEFYLKNEKIDPAANFEISDQVYDEFVEFLKKREFTYATLTERKLEELQKVAEDEKYKEKLESLLIELEKEISSCKTNDLEMYKDQIKEILKAEIVTRYYYQKGRVETMLKNDPEVAKAIELIGNKVQYKTLLTGHLKDIN
ncbi:MAG: S41 family peptidase [Bacteroidales bacterium]|nr:S41 family peptidase [Bacteroidales bacterium]